MCTKKTTTDSHFITMTRLIIKKEFLLQKIYQRPFVTIFVFKKMFLKILSHFSNVGKKVHYNYYIKYFGLLFVRKWIDLTSPIGIVPKLRKAFFLLVVLSHSHACLTIYSVSFECVITLRHDRPPIEAVWFFNRFCKICWIFFV